MSRREFRALDRLVDAGQHGFRVVRKGQSHVHEQPTTETYNENEIQLFFSAARTEIELQFPDGPVKTKFLEILEKRMRNKEGESLKKWAESEEERENFYYRLADLIGEPYINSRQYKYIKAKIFDFLSAKGLSSYSITEKLTEKVLAKTVDLRHDETVDTYLHYDELIRKEIDDFIDEHTEGKFGYLAEIYQKLRDLLVVAESGAELPDWEGGEVTIEIREKIVKFLKYYLGDLKVLYFEELDISKSFLECKIRPWLVKFLGVVNMPRLIHLAAYRRYNPEINTEEIERNREILVGIKNRIKEEAKKNIDIREKTVLIRDLYLEMMSIVKDEKVRTTLSDIINLVLTPFSDGPRLFLSNSEVASKLSLSRDNEKKHRTTVVRKYKITFDDLERMQPEFKDMLPKNLEELRVEARIGKLSITAGGETAREKNDKEYIKIFQALKKIRTEFDKLHQIGFNNLDLEQQKIYLVFNFFLQHKLSFEAFSSANKIDVEWLMRKNDLQLKKELERRLDMEFPNPKKIRGKENVAKLREAGILLD